MITVKVLSERWEIDEALPQCIRLAEKSGCTLPFQYLHVPLLWWDQFNNTDGTDFNRKRGTNFLGVRSQLQDIRLLVAMEGTTVAGAIPIVSYLVKVPGEKKLMRVFTFPGDYQLISRQDFIVSEGARDGVIRALLDSLMECIEDEEDVIILPYLSEDSPNFQDLMCSLQEASTKGFHLFTARTGRRGGVRPWTIDAILSCLRQIADRTVVQPLKDEMARLISEIAACPPMKLLFPQTRNDFEEKIRRLLGSLEENPVPAHVIEDLDALLADAPVIYPFIRLPKDRQTYMDTLGKSTRVNTQNLRNRFAKNGGEIEEVTSSMVTEQDIRDYLMLHNMRWGDASASLRGDASVHFHEDLCRKLSSRGCLTIFFAQYQGKRIAACSCIDIQGRREIYLTGRDPAYDEWSPGRLILFESIFDAVDKGFSTYDMGLGWFAYKMTFAKTYINTWNFFLSPRKRPDDFKKLYQGYECMISS